MATVIRGPSEDVYIQTVKDRLEAYEQSHHSAVAELFRLNPGSIWIRIVDDAFANVDRGQRHDSVSRFLEQELDDDTLQEIAILLPITPSEKGKLIMSQEFDSPIPSRIPA